MELALLCVLFEGILTEFHVRSLKCYKHSSPQAKISLECLTKIQRNYELDWNE